MAPFPPAFFFFLNFFNDVQARAWVSMKNLIACLLRRLYNTSLLTSSRFSQRSHFTWFISWKNLGESRCCCCLVIWTDWLFGFDVCFRRFENTGLVRVLSSAAGTHAQPSGMLERKKKKRPTYRTWRPAVDDPSPFYSVQKFIENGTFFYRGGPGEKKKNCWHGSCDREY